jgi:UDP-N-acetylmuramoyl-tripeptide--D-alanyl-D-alanine ligase
VSPEAPITVPDAPEARFTWNDVRVREALGLRTQAGRADLEYTGVSTDSRSIGEGELYVALVGDRFDGHDFVADAVAGGAPGAVVAKPVAGADAAVLYPVDDTLAALGQLAGYRRRLLPARVVGITGSTAKTTTKELLAGALGEALRVHATHGNYNNRIGLPLTLLSAPADAQVVVAELGTSLPGEIAALTGIADPEVAVITTVGEAHLEALGSVQGVLEEKLDILGRLPDEGRAVVGDEPPFLAEAARERVPGVRVAGWSERADPDLRPGDVEVDHWGYHSFAWRGARVTLQLPGRHMVTNALLALAVTEILGVAPEAAARGIGTVRPAGMRSEVRQVGGLTVVLDCYNANPPSVRAALEVLGSHGGEARRVAVLGSMLELGDESRGLHREVLRDALDRELEVVVATGIFAAVAHEVAEGVEEDRLVAVEDPRAAYALLRTRLEGHEIVLLKGSRSVALERLMGLLQEDFAEPGEAGGNG